VFWGIYGSAIVIKAGGIERGPGLRRKNQFLKFTSKGKNRNEGGGGRKSPPRGVGREKGEREEKFLTASGDHPGTSHRGGSRRKNKEARKKKGPVIGHKLGS